VNKNIKDFIAERIAAIDATTPESDEAELYLQGCKEELQRLRDRINSAPCGVCGCPVESVARV
jgi:hypothetical protein